MALTQELEDAGNLLLSVICDILAQAPDDTTEIELENLKQKLVDEISRAIMSTPCGELPVYTLEHIPAWAHGIVGKYVGYGI